MNNDDILVDDTEQNLGVAHAFFKDIYSKEDTDLPEEILCNLNVKLSEEEKAKLDADFSKVELQNAQRLDEKEIPLMCAACTNIFTCSILLLLFTILAN